MWLKSVACCLPRNMLRFSSPRPSNRVPPAPSPSCRRDSRFEAASVRRLGDEPDIDAAGLVDSRHVFE